MPRTCSSHSCGMTAPAMIERALDRVYGRISMVVQVRAARRLSELVPELVGDAVARWAKNGWVTYDHTEANCTIQLYRWLVEARRIDIRFHTFEVNLENVNPTPQMLEGKASVATASRPDVRISVRGAGIFLEAKRLMSTGDWCRLYVHEGMARYVASTYAATERVGMMVGYVQNQPDTTGLRDRINNYVHSHELMGPSHQLIEYRADVDQEWLTSDHARSSGTDVRLEHLWVVLP